MICPHCGKHFPRKSHPIANTKAKEVMELHARGYSLREIEEITGVSFSTAGRIVRTKKKTKP